MAKGGKQPGAGRPKGTPNKRTATARRAIADFVEGNVHRLNKWLDQMAEEDPEAAFKAFMSVVEYHVPRLARTELTGDPDKPITVSHAIMNLSGGLPDDNKKLLDGRMDALQALDGEYTKQEEPDGR